MLTLGMAGSYLDFYNQHVTNEDVTGFEGAELAPEIDVVGNYVNGVSVGVNDYELRPVVLDACLIGWK